MKQYESDLFYEKVHDYAQLSEPHYASDCIHEIVKEVSPNYPQLTEYEKEWLMFSENIYHAGEPVQLEYQQLTDITSGIIQNAIPFHYKCAILNGKTLVNHFDLSKWGEQERITLVADGTSKTIQLGKPSTVKADTKYLTIIPIYENTINNNLSIGGWNYYDSQPIIRIADGTGIIKKIETTRNTDDTFHQGLYMELWGENTSGQITFGKPMLIEYQEGMENWDIPYFEGMQSVKMPVLTILGKNLLNPNWEHNTWYPLELKSGTKLTLSTKDNVPSNGGNIRLMATDGTDIWMGIDVGATQKTITLQKDIYKLSNMLVGDIEYQLEIGNKTPYEHFKLNILTVNEDISLRSNSEVYDELDLLTGRLTQRIDENNEVLSQEVVKTVDLSTHFRPSEGTIRFETSSSTIAPLLTISCPVVSTGEQTLQEINN